MRSPSLLLPVLAIVLFSCETSRYLYSHSLPNQPAFEEKGESKVGGYVLMGDGGLGDKGNTAIDGQAAFALTDHFAVTASYYNRKELDNGSGGGLNADAIRYKRNLVELGGGYFQKINKAGRGFFNMYGGFGYGKFSIRDVGKDNDMLDYFRYHDVNIFKMYLQPGFRLGGRFSLLLLWRFSMVHYHNLNTNYTTEEQANFELNKISKTRTQFFFEPTAGFQFAIPSAEWIKIEGGMSFVRAGNVETRAGGVYWGLTFDLLTRKVR